MLNSLPQPEENNIYIQYPMKLLRNHEIITIKKSINK